MESSETMLKKIPKILSPELVKVLMEMGHGDTILLADANYPAHSMNNKVIRADGLNIPELLEAVLELMPLDSYSEYQVKLMQVVKGDNVQPTIWEEYHNISNKYFDDVKIEFIDRFDFYNLSKSCYAIVLTGEEALYGNIMLIKGVL